MGGKLARGEGDGEFGAAAALAAPRPLLDDASAAEVAGVLARLRAAS